MESHLQRGMENRGISNVAGVVLRVAMAVMVVVSAGVFLSGAVAGTDGGPDDAVLEETGIGETAFTAGEHLSTVSPNHGAVAVGSAARGPVSPTAGEMPANPVGDATTDGQISIADAQAIANYVIGNSPSPFDANLANVTREATGVSIADAQRVAEYTIAAVDPANTSISGFEAPTTLGTNAEVTESVTVANTGGMGTIQGVYYRVATDENFRDVVYEKRVDVVDLAPATYSGNETTVQFSVNPAVSGGEYTQGLFSEGLESNNASVVANLTVESGLYAGGNGTAANPYEIATWEHLDNVRENLSANFTLVSDLDSETAGYGEIAGPSANGGNGFEPLGDPPGMVSTEFTGTFDGNGHAIRNLSINRSNPGSYIGLFKVADGPIENLSILDANVTGSDWVGVLAGTASNVTDVHATGTVSGTDDVGGLVGELTQSMTESSADVTVLASGGDRAARGGLVGRQHGNISGSYATGDVIVGNSMTGEVGGLVGTTRVDGTSSGGPTQKVVNSYATGNVTSVEPFVGGLVGGGYNLVVDNAYATGNVNGTTDSGSPTGGLVGTGQNLVVNNSYATGNVTGNDTVGGIVGDITGNSGSVVQNSYATGNVTARNRTAGGLVGLIQEDSGSVVQNSYAVGDVRADSEAGGLVGEVEGGGAVNRSFAVGNVSAAQNAGGLVGVLRFDGTVKDAYWNTATSGQNDAIGQTEAMSFTSNLTGLTTGEMRGASAESSMPRLDFAGTWDVVDRALGNDTRNVSYPYLMDNRQTPAPGLETVESSSGAYAGGNGTAANPYEIATWEHLDNVRGNLSANFTLVSDLTETTAGYGEIAGPSANNGAGFDPIGDPSGMVSTEFTGTFDGNGHAIRNLSIDRSGSDDIGLFGVADGPIENLSILNADVTGLGQVGTLAGTASHATDVHATGTVAGGEDVGGLVGELTQEMRGASADVTVSNTGSDTFGWGGLVGHLHGNISGSHATGDVPVQSGMSGQIGGLVGYASCCEVVNSYATGNVTANVDRVGGLIGSLSNLMINNSYATGNVTASPSASYQSPTDRVGGLVGSGSNLVVTNSYATGEVTANRTVGGLVGELGSFSDSGSVIQNSYATGNITAKNSTSGGLVGRIERDSGSFIQNSYAVGDVRADSEAGGLVGEVEGGGVVNRSFAVGNVSAAQNAGGLVGVLRAGGTVEDAYWNTATSGQNDAIGQTEAMSSSGNLTGLTTGEMRGASAESSMSRLDFAGTWDVVDEAAGDSQRNVSYPYLTDNRQDPEPGLETIQAGSFAGGSGTAADPYQIATWKHLDNVRGNLSANFTLVSDLNETTAGYGSIAGPSANGGDGFEPIGRTSAFTGTFDGGGSTVRGLYLNRSAFEVGLFSVLDNATVTRAALEEVDITGDGQVGGVAGKSTGGTVSESYVTGNVTSTDKLAGGLVGWNKGGTVTTSYAVGHVTGNVYVGGLVGLNNDGTVTKSYATSETTGGSRVGGLVGWNRNGGTVAQSYAAGSVAGDSEVGGLVGESSAPVTDSYWDRNATGQTTSAGGTGLNTSDMKGGQAESSMSGFDFAGTWGVVNDTASSDQRNVSYPYLLDNQQEPAPGLETVETISGLSGLDIAGQGTNASIAAGNQTDVVVNVTNVGDLTGSFDVTLEIGTAVTETRTTSSLGAGETETVTFESVTGALSTGDYDVNVTTENDALSGTLTLAAYAGGNGTAADPYQIANWYHLDNVRENLGANFTMVDGLYRSTEGYDDVANSSANGGAGFEPLGNDTAPFTGTFDGDRNVPNIGWRITYLQINRSAEDYVGLFGKTQGATVTTVEISSASVVGNQYVGGVVGYSDGSEVNRSTVISSSVDGYAAVGGLVGTLSGGKILSSTAGADVNGSYTTFSGVGGLVGTMDGGTVTKSDAAGDVTGDRWVGGLVGYKFGDVTDSYARGDVSGDNRVGGLVGENYDNVTESYATGDVTADDGAVGGLIGKNRDLVSDSYARGNVTGNVEGTTFEGGVGGLIGYNDQFSPVSTSYATGNVTGDDIEDGTGGLIGTNLDVVANSYWDTNSTGQDSSAGGTGLNTSEMQGASAESNMTGFDFTDTWETVVGNDFIDDGYPRLQ